jgi:hypothetical protein
MKWLYPAICIFTILSVGSNYAITYFTTWDNKPKLVVSAIIFGVLCIFLAIATYQSTILDGKQKDRIEELAKLIRDLNTGGDSTYIAPLLSPGFNAELVETPRDSFPISRQSVLISFINKGDFALDGVKFHFHVLRFYRETSPLFLARQSAISFNIYQFFWGAHNSSSKKYLAENSGKSNPYDYTKEFDAFKPSQLYVSTLDCSYISTREPYQGYDIFIESRRQNWVVLLRCYKPPEKPEDRAIYSAYKILRVTNKGFKEIESYIQNGFPKEADGDIKWYSEALPPEWIIK